MHLPIGVLALLLCSVTLPAQHPLAYVADVRLVTLAGSGAALPGSAALWINPAAVGAENDWSYGASALQLTGVSRLKVVTGQAHYRNVALQLAATRLENYHALRYGATYAREIATGFRLGGTLTVFRQGIAGYSPLTGLLVSAGAQFRITDALLTGAYLAVPSDRKVQALRAGVGLGYRISANVALYADCRYDSYWGYSVHTGIGYAPAETLMIRLGYDGGSGAFSLGSSVALGKLVVADVAARYHPLLGGGGGAGFHRAGRR